MVRRFYSFEHAEFLWILKEFDNHQVMVTYIHLEIPIHAGTLRILGSQRVGLNNRTEYPAED